MRLRVIDQGLASPIATHAVPYGIAAALGEEPVLTLATPAAPYISVGVHQDIAAEIDEQACRTRGIPVLRRDVGGGAVLLDRDQLYFHFVFPRRLAPSRPERLFSRFLEPVRRSYRDLGIATRFRPPADVVAGDRKLGASAAGEIGEAIVIAGNFLFDFDAATMAACLKVPEEGFRPVLRRQLDERMTTMRRLLPALPARAQVRSLFLGHVATVHALAPIEDRPTQAEEEAIAAAAARQVDPDWLQRRGRRPQGDAG
jgi:lipoate-protein ligase A